MHRPSENSLLYISHTKRYWYLGCLATLTKRKIFISNMGT